MSSQRNFFRFIFSVVALVLLLRIEEQTLGGALTLRSIILRVSVDQRFFDSCEKDDEITDSPWIESLTESMIGDFRIFVADKFTVSH